MLLALFALWGMASRDSDDGSRHGRWSCRGTVGPRTAQAPGAGPDRADRIRDECDLLLAPFLSGQYSEAIMHADDALPVHRKEAQTATALTNMLVFARGR